MNTPKPDTLPEYPEPISFIDDPQGIWDAKQGEYRPEPPPPPEPPGYTEWPTEVSIFAGLTIFIFWLILGFALWTAALYPAVTWRDYGRTIAGFLAFAGIYLLFKPVCVLAFRSTNKLIETACKALWSIFKP